MIGSMTPASMIAAQLAQPQEPQAPFQWGQGGRRMTPDDIARERELAARMTQTNYSPIYSPWQGLARVSENLLGAMRERKADSASERNADYGQQIIQSLLNPGGSPSASGAPGGSPPSPGANIAQLSAIVADPYLPDSAKAVAQMQLEQGQRMAMKQFEYANREQPEIVQLANIARDTTQPAEIRRAAQDRITALNDPTLVIPGLPTGTYVGPRSGVGMAFGQAPDDAPETLPPDFFDDDPPPISAAPPRVDENAAMAKARAEGDEYLRRLLGGK